MSFLKCIIILTFKSLFPWAKNRCLYFVVLRPRKSLLLENVPYCDSPRKKTWSWFTPTETNHFSSVFFICDRPRHVSDIGQGSNHSFFISTGISHRCHNNITIITYMLVQSWCDCVELNAMNCHIVNSICLAECWINCKKCLFQHNCSSFLGTGQIYTTF